MNRSKRRVAGLGAGALAVTLVAATFAYYTSNASVDNLFHTSDYGWRTVEEFTPEQTVEPGSKITKDVTVENTGGSDLVVRVKMEEKWVYDGEDDPFITLASSNDAFHSVVFDGEADPNTYTATQAGVSGATDGQTAGDESVMYKLLSDSPNWKLGTDGYWYYTKLLGQGETTDSLLEAVIMATNADMGLYQNTDVLYSVASVDTINSLKEAVEAAFDLQNLELRDVVERMAEELFEAVEDPAGEKWEVHAPTTPPEPLKPLRPVGMLYTPLTKRAMAICFNAHKNQLDKGGLPYVFHPFHLAEQMETEAEVCTALLHDVVEDSGYTPGELSQAGFPNEVVQAVRALTRGPQMRYLDYVARLRQNPIARRVKLADLAHNSDLSRLGYVSDRDRRRVLKYRMAQAILEDDRYDRVLEHFRKVLPLSLDEPLFLSVFYDRQGVVQKYSIDIEKAEDSHYEFDARQGEKLRLALDPSRTLPDALADWAEEGCSCFRVESMLRKDGIAFQPFHYY